MKIRKFIGSVEAASLCLLLAVTFVRLAYGQFQISFFIGDFLLSGGMVLLSSLFPSKTGVRTCIAWISCAVFSLLCVFECSGLIDSRCDVQVLSFCIFTFVISILCRIDFIRKIIRRKKDKTDLNAVLRTTCRCRILFDFLFLLMLYLLFKEAGMVPSGLQILLLVLVAFWFVCLLIRFWYEKNVVLGQNGVEDSAWQQTLCPLQKRQFMKGAKPVRAGLKELFLKCSDLMDKSKLYLQSSCSIDMVAHQLYTNKTYLSNAVNRFAEMNFNTYINHLRVQYAMEVFKSDTHLRVGELAARSGFNNDVSFNDAFKEYQKMTPKQWCQEYRNSIQKK